MKKGIADMRGTPPLSEKIRFVVFDGVPKIKAWFWIQSSLVLPKSFTLVPDKKVFFFRSYLILLEGKKMQMRCRARGVGDGRWALFIRAGPKMPAFEPIYN